MLWFTKLMKQFFFWIDKIVYNFIPAIYDLLLELARTSVLSQADISNMAERIYKLLAIFMIFKVTLSLISYVVNPDDFSDKSKGVAKLGSNIIISLSLLILTPYIFSYAYQIQTIILEDNSLATLIFGGNEEKESFLNSAGDEIAYMTMSAFFSPNLSLGNLHECSTLTIGEEGKFNPDCSGMDANFGDLNKTDSMHDLLKKANGSTYDLTVLKNYVAGVENKNLGLMFRQDLVLATVDYNKETVFVMDYKFIFSTALGIVIILLLLTYCMDVAVRSLKLAFLQLISPIPILSYVDPKSGKDGMFKKWYEMCFSAYLSLFIRLIALYFAVYIISLVADRKLVDIIDGSYQTNMLLKLFVIIGALMFAKQLPEMLKGLGIKLDGAGKFTLNPLKKLENEALGGKKLTGMARGALVGTAGALSGAGLGRGISGAWRGFTSGKGWSETGKAERDMNSKMRQAKLDGSSFAGRLGARISNATGLVSEGEIIAKQKHALQEKIDKAKNEKEAVEANIAPRRTQIANNSATAAAIDEMQKRAVSKIKQGSGVEGARYKKLLRDAAQAEAEHRGADAEALRQQAEGELNKKLRDSWINSNLQSPTGDGKLNDLYKMYCSKAEASGHTVESDASGLDNQSQAINTENTDIQIGIAKEEQQIKKYDEELKADSVKMQAINKRERAAKANESVVK